MTTSLLHAACEALGMDVKFTVAADTDHVARSLLARHTDIGCILESGEALLAGEGKCTRHGGDTIKIPVSCDQIKACMCVVGLIRRRPQQFSRGISLSPDIGHVRGRCPELFGKQSNNFAKSELWGT